MKLLSIVIPTRNRECYCIEVLRNVLTYNRNDFEVCVCDNSDTDKIEKFLNNVSDKRIVYRHIKGRINSVVNMDTAIGMATGDYICMIGDDDTILPDIFTIVEWAKSNDFVNVTPRFQISFFWPNSISKNGRLFWDSEVCKGKEEILTSELQLEKFVCNGLYDYSSYLPRVYHGIVKRDILSRIKAQTGHFIGGLSPDIYMAVTTACSCKEFVTINSPITIAGACPTSSTADNNTGGHRGSIECAPHLFGKTDYQWDKRIPEIYSVETIWGETAIKALQEMNRDDLLRKINQGYLFAELLKNHHNMGAFLIKSIMHSKLENSFFSILFNFVKFFFVKPTVRLYRGYPKFEEYNGIENIRDAVNIYLNKYKSNNKY